MRQFLKNEHGEKMLTTRSPARRKALFMVAGLIEQELGITPTVVNTYEPITDSVMLGLHLLPPGEGFSEEQLNAMRRIWREFL